MATNREAIWAAGQIGGYGGVPIIKSAALDKRAAFAAMDPARNVSSSPIIAMGWLALAKLNARLDARQQVAEFAARYGL